MVEGPALHGVNTLIAPLTFNLPTFITLHYMQFRLPLSRFDHPIRRSMGPAVATAYSSRVPGPPTAHVALSVR